MAARYFWPAGRAGWAEHQLLGGAVAAFRSRRRCVSRGSYRAAGLSACEGRHSLCKGRWTVGARATHPASLAPRLAGRFARDTLGPTLASREAFVTALCTADSCR
jgi:hypothetical protein